MTFAGRSETHATRAQRPATRRTQEDGGRNPKFEYRNPKQLPNQKSKPKRRRKSAVPQGQPTVAHRFNGGIRRQSITSPEGTVEVQSHKYHTPYNRRVIQPSLRDVGNVELAPALKHRAILTMSLRDTALAVGSAAQQYFSLCASCASSRLARSFGFTTRCST